MQHKKTSKFLIISKYDSMTVILGANDALSFFIRIENSFDR
jgi:hypothetical protein